MTRDTPEAGKAALIESQAAGQPDIGHDTPVSTGSGAPPEEAAPAPVGDSRQERTEVVPARSLTPEAGNAENPAPATGGGPAAKPPAARPPHDPDALFRTDDLQKGSGQRVGKAAGLVLLFAGMKFLFQIGSTAVLARLIPPEQHGLVAMAMPIMALSIALSQFGLAQALVQRAEVTHDLASSLFWMNVGLGLICTLGLALLGYPAAAFYGEPQVLGIFVALSPSVLFSAMLAQYVATLRRRLRIREIETSGIVALFASFGAAVVAALMGAGYWALVLQQVLMPLINLVMLAASLRWVPANPFRLRFAKAADALRFGGNAALSSVVTQAAHGSATVIAGQYFSPAITGAYYRSWTLATLPQRQIVGALSGAFVPGLSRLQNDPAGFSSLFGRIVSRMDLIMMPIAIMFCVTPDLVVPVLLGPAWGMMVPILGWMGVLIISTTILNACVWALLAKGHGGLLSRLSISMSGLIVVALLAGAQFGPVAMTASYALVSLLVRVPITLWILVRLKVVGLKSAVIPFTEECAIALVIGFGLYGFRLLLPPMHPFVELMLCGMVTLLAYAVRVLVDRGLREDVLKLIQRKRRAKT